LFGGLLNYVFFPANLKNCLLSTYVLTLSLATYTKIEVLFWHSYSC